jgi:hypothetical protein
MRGRFLHLPIEVRRATLRRVRRLVVLAAAAAALAACGASAASTSTKPIRIVFGLGGGNIVPFQVAIGPTGRVRASGGVLDVRRRQLPQAKVVSLSRLVRHELPALKSRQCAGTLPDVGSDFVQALGRTVRVHGSCEPRFHRLWNTLARAVGVGRG